MRVNKTSNCKTVRNRVVPDRDNASIPSENYMMCFENIDERTLPMLTDHCDEISISQPTVVSHPYVLSTAITRLEVELESGPSTLNGPSGLLIREKFSVLEPTKRSSLSQFDVSINVLMNQPEFTRVSPQLEVPSNQQPIDSIRSESTAQATENPLPTTSHPEPIITSGVNQNKICS